MSNKTEETNALTNQKNTIESQEYLKIEENVKIPNYDKGEIITEDVPAIFGSVKTDNMSDNKSNDESSSDAFSRMEKSLKKLKKASESHPQMPKCKEIASEKTLSGPKADSKPTVDKNDLLDTKSDITDSSYYLINPNIKHETRRTPDVPEYQHEDRSSAPDVPPRKYRRL